MSPEEKSLLTDLFNRTRGAASTPRDPEAEDLIGRGLREQPHAAYFLAQAVIIQDQALNALTTRIQDLQDQIAELERQKPAELAQQTSGGFLGGLSGLFGGGQAQTQSQRSGQLYDDFARSNRQQASSPPAPSPWGRDGATSGPWGQGPASAGGGGFLRGALTTAAGVAGGVLVADAVRDLFSPHMGGSNGLFGSNFGNAGGLFGSGNTPVEETVVNNYFLNDGSGGSGNDDIQQADDQVDDDDWFDAGNDGDDSYV